MSTSLKAYRAQRAETRARKQADDEEALAVARELLKKLEREHAAYARNTAFPADEAKAHGELASRIRRARALLQFLHADDIELRELRADTRRKESERRQAEQTEKQRLRDGGFATCPTCRFIVKESSIGMRTTRADGHTFGGRRVSVCSVEGAELWPQCPRCRSRHYEAHGDGFRCVADGCGATWSQPEPQLLPVEKPDYRWTVVARALELRAACTCPVHHVCKGS